MVDTGVEWIDRFHDDSCNAPNCSYHATHALGFQNAMTAHGHKAVFAWGDDNAWETDFRDNAFGGDSFHWSESVHFCFYSDHGRIESDILKIGFSVPHANCRGSSDTWRLGYWGNLKWLVLDCCEAVVDSAQVPNVWFGPMQGIDMVFGFLGDSHDSWWSSSLGSDFGNDAGSGQRLADSWLDHAYSFWLNDCAIAIAAGNTQDEAILRREYESIGWLWWRPIASTNWLAWKWRG